ncbi:MAG: PepSY-like domain-containing protein [Pedobacter sp.]|nr:PepSY-like domain-containing protein [Pedobacter sp.]
MRNSLIMLIAFLGLTISACMQKNIPTVVKDAFSKGYPNVKAEWDKEGDKYEAGFKMNGNTMSVLYNAKGLAEETEMDMKADMLPVTIKTYITNNFKSEEIKEAAKITKADGTVIFEAEINGKDYLFTPEGKFIKSVEE